MWVLGRHDGGEFEGGGLYSVAGVDPDACGCLTLVPRVQGLCD
jgi:hypothetical protein